MIYIGAVLWFADGRKMMRNRAVYLLSLNRLIIVPLMILGIFILISHFFPSLTDSKVVSVLVMQAAMPCMVNVVIMVNILGGDDGIATANVFISTLLSVITLPLILMIISMIY